MERSDLKFLAILTVRNEGAFLLDWLAHHRAVGITDVLVFSNDCQDGTDAMLDRLAEMGWLTHLRNDGPHGSGGIQFTALKRAARHEKPAIVAIIDNLNGSHRLLPRAGYSFLLYLHTGRTVYMSFTLNRQPAADILITPGLVLYLNQEIV